MVRRSTTSSESTQTSTQTLWGDVVTQLVRTDSDVVGRRAVTQLPGDEKGRDGVPVLED